jgi:hypothetical protein
MKEMKLDELRKGDEIQPRPTAPRTMKMLFQQGQPRPASRDAMSLPPLAVFLPPKPQTDPSWGAQVKTRFRDISGMQRKCEVAYINKNRQVDNWDRDYSQVFQLPMVVIDERTSVEADDVPTCRPDYDDPPQSASPMSAKRLPTSSVATPTAVRLEPLGQIASNTSPKALEHQARILLWTGS